MKHRPLLNRYNQTFDEFIVYFDNYSDIDSFDELTNELISKSWEPNFEQLEIGLPIYSSFTLMKPFLAEAFVLYSNELEEYMNSRGKLIYKDVFTLSKRNELEVFLKRVVVRRIPESYIHYSPRNFVLD